MEPDNEETEQAKQIPSGEGLGAASCSPEAIPATSSDDTAIISFANEDGVPVASLFINGLKVYPSGEKDYLPKPFGKGIGSLEYNRVGELSCCPRCRYDLSRAVCLDENREPHLYPT